MVGREAYQNPSLLGYIDQMLLMLMRISSHQDKRWKPCSLTLKTAEPRCLSKSYRSTYARRIPKLQRARQWRRYLNENAFKQGAGIEVVETALSFVETN